MTSIDNRERVTRRDSTVSAARWARDRRDSLIHRYHGACVRASNARVGGRAAVARRGRRGRWSLRESEWCRDIALAFTAPTASIARLTRAMRRVILFSLAISIVRGRWISDRSVGRASGCRLARERRIGDARRGRRDSSAKAVTDGSIGRDSLRADYRYSFYFLVEQTPAIRRDGISAARSAADGGAAFRRR